ncbi:MAG: AI-2E family transporter, partial [Planctomycetes bacterium]|nr:AI-2E family transporter [Planctomycetota bacterium]
MNENLQRAQTYSLILLATIAVGVCMHILASVVVPFVIAMMIYFALTPLINKVRSKLRVGRWLAIGVTGLLTAGALTLVGMLLVSTISDVQNNTASYGHKIAKLVGGLLEILPGEMDYARLVEMATNKVKALAPLMLGGATDVLSSGILVLLFLMFLLAGKALSDDSPKLLREIEHSVQKYVNTKLFLSALTGFLTWLILTIFGVEFAAAIGMLTFLLNFIPSVGSIIAMALPVPLVLLGDHSSGAVIAIFVLIGGVQGVIGNVIEPKMMGKSLGLHPITIMISLVLFGVIWGVPGMFLATPLTSMIKIASSKSEVLRPLASLLE